MAIAQTFIRHHFFYSEQNGRNHYGQHIHDKRPRCIHVGISRSRANKSFSAERLHRHNSTVRNRQPTCSSRKNCGGINLLMGLGKGITASCSLQNNTLVVNYLEGDWIGKIIGLAVGWILCFIPFITAIIGCIQQVGLPNEINMEISAAASRIQSTTISDEE